MQVISSICSRKEIKILLKKKKTKREDVVVSGIRISQKMKNKDKLSIEKNIMRCEKIRTKSLSFRFLAIRAKCDNFRVA